MVIRGARIWGSTESAIGIRGDRIVPAEIGPNTRVIEASGATVVPGFQDAHVHTPFAGLNMLRVWLHDAVDRREYLQIITEHVRSHPGSDWITGGGWAMSAFPGGNPHKADLDAIVASVKKTGRCVVVHEATLTSGFGAELAALVQENCFYHLEAPIERVTGWDTPYPHAQEWAYFPGPARVGAALQRTMEA